MKKIVGLLVVLLAALNLYAQKIPEGRKLPALVMDFVTDPEAWSFCTPVELDPANEAYVVKGYCIQKILAGYQKQEYTVSISRTDNELNISVSDMSSVACDKNGKVTGKRLANPKSTMDKLSGLIKNDLAKRISTWSDDEYNERTAKTYTSPLYLEYLQKNKSISKLWLKKFAEENVNGKEAEFEVVLSSIDENDNKAKPEFAYKATSQFELPVDVTDIASVVRGGYTVFILSNSETLAASNNGAKYKVHGIVNYRNFSDTWLYTIEEK